MGNECKENKRIIIYERWNAWNEKWLVIKFLKPSNELENLKPKFTSSFTFIVDVLGVVGWSGGWNVWSWFDYLFGLLKKDEGWTKGMKDEPKVHFSAMLEELYVPKQLRKGDFCCKWLVKGIYGSLYWNKYTATNENGNVDTKIQTTANLWWDYKII